MFDILAIFCFIFGVLGIVFMFMFIFGEVTKWYYGLPALVIGLILYFIIIYSTPKENFLIDKNSVRMQRLELSEHRYELIFSDTLRVERTEYDMPYGTFWDYETYRIYLDSTAYIEIHNPRYDTLDMQSGNKLFK